MFQEDRIAPLSMCEKLTVDICKPIHMSIFRASSFKRLLLYYACFIRGFTRGLVGLGAITSTFPRLGRWILSIYVWSQWCSPLADKQDPLKYTTKSENQWKLEAISIRVVWFQAMWRIYGWLARVCKYKTPPALHMYLWVAHCSKEAYHGRVNSSCYPWESSLAWPDLSGG